MRALGSFHVGRLSRAVLGELDGSGEPSYSPSVDAVPKAESAQQCAERAQRGIAAMYRWWIYQRERFPILAHGLLIAAFSLSALCASILLRGQITLPGWLPAVVAFVTAFLFFLQLRIADEFKDFEEDSRYRPYRPVPRGLVTLRELGVLGVITSCCQLALAFVLQLDLALLLLVVWLYLALMSKEFFVGDWLKRRPILYLASHML